MRPAPPAQQPVETGSQLLADHTDILQQPPLALLADSSLFLDFDGTLVELIDHPDEVVADAELRALLLVLHARLNGRLAIVSGRSLAQLDAILGPVAQSVSLSGSHGTEHRFEGRDARPPRPTSLDEAVTRLRPFAGRYPGALIEEKSLGVALHYRMRPEAGEAAMKLASAVATELQLHLQAGRMMVELRTPGGGKDVAVRRLMQRPPMAGTRPIFIGDDLTDEAGFEAAAALGGEGILAGAPRATAARYRLAGPTAVRDWLQGALA